MSQESTQTLIQRGAVAQLRYYSQFLYRYVFAGLMFAYMHHAGITPGVFEQHQIAAAMLLYVLAVMGVMLIARRQRLSPALQRTLVLLDLMAFVIGVPHDPNPGMPTAFAFYLAYADIGLRYRLRLYIDALKMGAVALMLVLYLRIFQTEAGLHYADIWQACLLVIIVLHGLQVFAGRDRARRLVRESQDRLTLALSAPGVGAWASSSALDELVLDGHIRESLGLKGAEFNNRMVRYLDHIHPEDRDRVIAHYKNFLKSQAVDYEDSYRIIKPNGQEGFICARARAERDATGRAVSVAGMVWDLSTQHRQQQALERIEERYRIATQSAQVAVWMLYCQEDRFEHDGNTHALLNLPKDAQVLTLTDVLARLHPDDQALFAQQIATAAQGTDHEFFGEVRVVTDDHHSRVLQVRASIERDASGAATRIAGASWDATQLVRARQELERSNRDLDDFAYIASHDLKEPLRGIASYAGYLEQDYGPQLDSTGRAMVQRIKHQTTRMEGLINDLLTISRIGRTTLTLEPVDLNSLLRDVLESVEFLLREHQVEIRRPAPLPVWPCDAIRVRELLRNLIINAAKYNDKATRWIEIGHTGQGLTTRFYVRDNGIGIHPDQQGRIYTLFERLHRRDAYGGGNGVGLTIVKKIVLRHGGDIWLDSTPGHGSTFWFTLPPQRPAGATP